MLHGLWDLPESGMEPMSPEVAGGFFATEPPVLDLWVNASDDASSSENLKVVYPQAQPLMTIYWF